MGKEKLFYLPFSLIHTEKRILCTEAMCQLSKGIAERKIEFFYNDGYNGMLTDD